ncbi:MAG: hypothetical protein HQ462_02180, partial [Deltaproteobacteria bacterium]|nr:hypothetical protein [Deltaproteobacteria bacterium]
MGENQNKPSGMIRKDIHTTLSDILDFGTDNITMVSPQNTVNHTHDRLKKLLKQLQ